LLAAARIGSSGSALATGIANVAATPTMVAAMASDAAVCFLDMMLSLHRRYLFHDIAQIPQLLVSRGISKLC
jgi:hypothetical protein